MAMAMAPVRQVSSVQTPLAGARAVGGAAEIIGAGVGAGTGSGSHGLGLAWAGAEAASMSARAARSRAAGEAMDLLDAIAAV